MMDTLDANILDVAFVLGMYVMEGITAMVALEIAVMKKTVVRNYVYACICIHMYIHISTRIIKIKNLKVK